MTLALRHPVVREDLARIAGARLPWERLDGRTVLVTGAGGLVASYLVEALLARRELHGDGPARVIGVVRDMARARRRFAAYEGEHVLELLEHDVSEPLRHDGLIDLIVHAAGRAMPSAFGSDPIGTYLPSVLGTHHLLARAHADRVSGFLLISSGAVHGAVPEGQVIQEDVYGALDPLDLRSSYAEGKRIAETMCRSWEAQRGVPARIARLGHTYGPGLSRHDERAFADFAFAVVDRRDIVLNSDGSAVRSYCYLADAIEGLLRVLLQGDPGEAYLVVNPTATCSVLELATTVAALHPERGIQVRRGDSPVDPAYLPNRDPARLVDIGKINSLGWNPMTSLSEGFRRTIESLL